MICIIRTHTYLNYTSKFLKIMSSCIYDKRGHFREVSVEKLIKHKLIFTVVSKSKKNVLRGLHFQKKNPQGKYLSVLKGEIFDVALDCRPKSETFGMTMIEAMKCGLPILATRNQISTEILSSAGFFCKDTAKDIQAGILKIINNKKNFQSKIMKGIKISKKFKWKIASENTFNFLEKFGK